MKHLLTSVSLVLFSASVFAQVPHGYIVTAEQPRSLREGLNYIDPATGIVTAVRMEKTGVLGGASTIAIDRSDRTGLYTSAGASIGGAPVLRLEMAGNLIRSQSGGALRQFGRLGRMYVVNKQILFTLRSVGPGLWSMSISSLAPRLMWKLQDAFDIAVIGGKAYINSFKSGANTEIVEVDLSSGKARSLGNSYPTIQGLGTLGASLLAGTTGGDLLLISTTSGKATTFRKTGKGAITAVVEGPKAGQIWFATASGEVYNLANLSKPVYKTTNVMNDIDIGVQDQASLLLYGKGCAGTNGRTPKIDHVGAPALGKAFTMQVSSAKPQSGAVFFLGASRTMFGTIPLPLDLKIIGMPGCNLLTDIVLAAPLGIDNQGKGRAGFTVPGQASFKGVHFMGQFLIADSGGNSFGLVSSDAAEAIVR